MHFFFSLTIFSPWSVIGVFFYSRDPRLMSLVDLPWFAKFSKMANFNFREMGFLFYFVTRIMPSYLSLSSNRFRPYTGCVCLILFMTILLMIGSQLLHLAHQWNEWKCPERTWCTTYYALWDQQKKAQVPWSHTLVTQIEIQKLTWWQLCCRAK